MRNLGLIWLVALAFKLALSAWLPLSADEAYYWVWSHHLQLSYFDHPPMIAWINLLGHPLDNFFQAVRWPGVIAGHLALWAWIELFRRHATIPFEKMQTWMAMMLFAPLTGPGSIFITPDIPLMLFWPLALICYRQLVVKKTPVWALALGLTVGLGFAGKYIMALFVPLSLLAILSERPRPKNVGLWIALATAGFFVASAPVWIWNWQNDFVSFLFQLKHGLGRPNWKPSWTYEYILVQTALIFPPVLWFALKSKAPLWMRIFAWGPIVIFAMATARGYVEANWPIVAYPMILALAAQSAPLKSRWLSGTVTVWALLLTILLTHLAFDWLPIQNDRTKLRELTTYNQLVETTRPLTPVLARSYQMASKLSFELKRPVFKLRGMNRVDFFDFRSESMPSSGHYFLAVETGDDLPDEWKQKGHHIINRTAVDSHFSVFEVEAP